MVTLIRTEITGPDVTGGGLSTFAVEDPTNDADLETTIGYVVDFWDAMATNYLDDGVTFQVLSTQPRYAASTGELQSVFGVDGGDPVTGAVTGANTGRATQALCRWRTNNVVNGRLLQGRTFIPGIPASAMTDTGLLSSTYVVGMGTVCADFVSNMAAEFLIWHRPQNGVGGSTEAVTGSSVWNQLAVLRSRRD